MMGMATQTCRLQFCWSTLAPEENSVIRGYDSRLCMFSYYQIHPISMNKTNGAPSSKDGVRADVKTNTKSWSPQLTSSFLSGIKTI
jgi:hypothetical protein